MRWLVGLIGMASVCGACSQLANPSAPMGLSEKPSAATNPISRLNARSILSVSVKPVAIGGSWIELLEDGNKFVLHSVEPGGVSPSPPTCDLQSDKALALVEKLAAVGAPKPALEPHLGDYCITIRTRDELLTGRVQIAKSSGVATLPAFAAEGVQYQLDPRDLDALRELIASAHC